MKRNLSKLFISCFLLSALFCFAPRQVVAADPDDFQKGVAAYESGDFETAGKQFEDLLQSGLNAGEVYYNLGNTYFRQQKLGRAIAVYLQAQRLMPRDSDLRYNLNYLRKQTKDRIEPGQTQVAKRALLFWVYFLNLPEWLWILVICNTVFWATLTVWFWQRKEWTQWVAILSLIFLLFGGMGSAVHFFGDSQAGVVTEPEVTIYSGPGTLNTQLFRLHEGTEFQVKDREGDWLRLALADGKEGWLQKTLVAMVGE